MKHLKNLSACGALVLSVCLVGCSKKEDAATKAGPITTSSGSEPVALKLKWQAGKKYNEQLIVGINVHIELPQGSQKGKPMDQKMSMTDDYSITVGKDSSSGGKELELTLDNIKMEARMGGRVMFKADTSEAPPKQQGPDEMFRKIVGGKLDFDTDADGKIVKISGVEDFAKRIGDDEDTLTVTKTILSDDTLKRLVGGGQVLPDKAVKIGDEWPGETSFQIPHWGKVTAKLKYTFKGWQDRDSHKCAVIGFSGDFSSKVDDKSSQVTLEKGSILGDTWFDPDLGAPVDTIIDEDIKMKGDMMGKVTEFPIKPKIEVKLVSIDDLPK